MFESSQWGMLVVYMAVSLLAGIAAVGIGVKVSSLVMDKFSKAKRSKTNRAFWNAKFRANVRRDQEHEKLWTQEGWNVIVIWECGLKTVADRKRTFANLSKWLMKELKVESAGGW